MDPLIAGMKPMGPIRLFAIASTLTLYAIGVPMKKSVLTLFALITMLYLTGNQAVSAEASFPDLTAQELKRMLDSGQKVFLLNPLPSLLFRQGHIPGSFNIRWHSLDASNLMPADKHTPIVTYCMGPR